MQNKPIFTAITARSRRPVRLAFRAPGHSGSVVPASRHAPPDADAITATAVARTPLIATPARLIARTAVAAAVDTAGRGK